MDGDVKTVKTHADALGFDAITTYAIAGGTVQVNKSYLILS
jgi:hypothetical protein